MQAVNIRLNKAQLRNCILSYFGKVGISKGMQDLESRPIEWAVQDGLMHGGCERPEGLSLTEDQQNQLNAILSKI